MIATSSCEHCGAVIEFNAEQFQAGAVGDCHACGQTSALILPAADDARRLALSLPRPALLPEAEEKPDRVEDSLESAGVACLLIGCAAGVVIFIYGIYQQVDKRDPSGFWWIGAGLAVIIHSVILKVLFYAFAEAIRLLRRAAMP